MTRTLTLSTDELTSYSYNLMYILNKATLDSILNKTILGNMIDIIPYLPSESVDLLFLDPPYNISKTFNKTSFKKTSSFAYKEWFKSWFIPLLHVLKPTASIYVCSDWSTPVQEILMEHLIVRNRITWERDKGRGALSNWKNCSEDIWFATKSQKYTFNVDAVKLKRKVLAPYKKNGTPKDWFETCTGKFRLTCPSNLWTDITIPFWSMSENTKHPTQKPEKLLAKIILASSNPGDVILDPFLGSGTTSVVAKKLSRQYIGIELDTEYCCIAEKRLKLAEYQPKIQGYTDGVFLARNMH